VQHHQRNPDDNRNHHVHPHAGEHQPHDGHHRKGRRHRPIVHRGAGHHHRLVPEEVEKEPCDQRHQKHDYRERVPEEAEKENKQHHHEVVDAEVVEVASHAHGGFGDGVGTRERVEREQLFPWSARGKRGACGCGGACDEVRASGGG